MQLKRKILGIGLCILLAFSAKNLSSFFPVLGSTSIAIILGALVGNLFNTQNISSGIKIVEKKFLKTAIALTGLSLNLKDIVSLGGKGISFIAILMGLTIVSGVFIGRTLGFSKKFSLSVSSGYAICGSSAIAATAPIIKSEEEEVGLAMAITSLMGTITMFTLPFLIKNYISLTDFESGALIGGTLQAIAQAVAGGAMVSKEVQVFSTLFKMIRVSLLGAIVLIYGKIGLGEDISENEKHKIKIPLFIYAFFALCLANTFLKLPPSLVEDAKFISKNLLLISITAIGMKISTKKLLGSGINILLYGLIFSFVQISLALLLIRVLF